MITPEQKSPGEQLLERASRASDAAARLRSEASLMLERCVSAINLNNMADRIRDGRRVGSIEIRFEKDGVGGAEHVIARLYSQAPLLEPGDTVERDALERTLRDAAFRTVAVAEDEIRGAGIELDQDETSETN